MFIYMDHHRILITVIYNVRQKILADYKEYFPPGKLIFPKRIARILSKTKVHHRVHRSSPRHYSWPEHPIHTPNPSS